MIRMASAFSTPSGSRCMRIHKPSVSESRATARLLRGPDLRVEQIRRRLALLVQSRGPLPVEAFGDLREQGPCGRLAPEGVPQGEHAAVADGRVEICPDQGQDARDRVGGSGGEGRAPDIAVLLVLPAQGLGEQGLLGLEVEDRDPLRQARRLRHGGQRGRRQAVADDQFDRGVEDLGAAAGGVVGTLAARAPFLQQGGHAGQKPALICSNSAIMRWRSSGGIGAWNRVLSLNRSTSA